MPEETYLPHGLARSGLQGPEKRKGHLRDESRRGGSVDHYTVGWICALQEEYESACRMLDEELNDLEVLDERDNNTYVFGRISGHCVVIGCLPPGRYGTNSASRVAQDMVRSFPSLRFALMVGIGGGLPTPQRDIRLGDVIVGTPSGTLGGVVQYDLGKLLPGGSFQPTGHLDAPPDKLLGAIPEVRRRYNDPRTAESIGEHIRRMDDMPEYRRPTIDYLYHSDCTHQGGQNCHLCDRNHVVERPDRAGRAVIVHYGTIASGNTVIKDAIMRDQFASSTMNPLCFEMEAAGLMNNLPCMVIRGICDYSDSHKNDEWHNYAALTAAAYARELLLTLRRHKVAQLPLWKEKTKPVGKLISAVPSGSPLVERN
ncbi:5'-methylthioadenosine/S-adenosylhomocysteine nucleosidase family protein [Aspergillus clavatus NRRL 1]|uniref:Uncharacterized protein n=1 Tax=Aspergillus clavatus (strain ATCC 1007 / CBS 513.65 / DSM 816 / NCTC 3887 / NRRL 1 / QM 1276 / 107) TaxID=344612 RepID=A1CE15_ASPCL|nr:uncharacterized protein ACLA_008520 [Aspergillus clavatus NRRL 1]EAW12092.1 hypothetical protein ACLA_008520 [Aspergillus clavatus NRRL 1]